MKGTPSAVVKANGVFVVFTIGFDSVLWHRWQFCDGCGWSAWAVLGGQWTTSYPMAGRFSDNRLYVQAWDDGFNLWSRTQFCDGCGWADWVV